MPWFGLFMKVIPKAFPYSFSFDYKEENYYNSGFYFNHQIVLTLVTSFLTNSEDMHKLPSIDGEKSHWEVRNAPLWIDMPSWSSFLRSDNFLSRQGPWMAVQTGDLCALADASNRLSTQMSWLPLSLPQYSLHMPVLCENSFQCVCHLLAAMRPWYSYQNSVFSHLYKGA